MLYNTFWACLLDLYKKPSQKEIHRFNAKVENK